jgi:transcriptional regulator with XRE-family HTH domain
MPVAEKIRGIALTHLRAWRIARVLNQTELAEKADVGRSTVIRAERGDPISFANARALAEALDVTVQQLAQRDPTPEEGGLDA